MRFSLRRSLAGRIVAILLCVAVVPLAVYMAIAAPAASRTLVDVVGNNLASECELVAGDIDRFLEQLVSTTRLLSQADVLESEDFQSIRQYLAEAAEADPAILNLYVLDLKGSTQASSRAAGDLVSDESQDPSIAGKDLIAACVAARQGDVFVSEAMRLPGGIGLLLATPITDDSNQVVVKVLLVEIAMARIQDILARYDGRVPSDKFVYVVDEAGHVVTSRNPAVASLERFRDLDAAPPLATMLADSSPSGRLSYRDADGTQVVAGYSELPAVGSNRALDWCIVAVARADVIWMPVRAMRNGMLMFGMFLTLGSVGLAWFLTRSVTAPLKRFEQAAEQMRQGRYELRLPDTGISEFEQVNRALESMASVVADRKRQLGASVKRYRDLFENMNAGFVLFEVVQDDDGVPVDLVVVDANEGFELTTGLKAPDVTGKRLTRVLPGIEGDAADWISTFGTVALTGEPRQFEQGSELLGRDYSIAAYRPAPGQCAVTFSDITERKAAEEELRRKEQMVSSSQDMMAMLGRDYDYLAVNDAYVAAFGKTKEELLGRTVPDIFGPEFFEAVIKPHAQSCFEGEEIRYRAWFEFPIHGRRHMDVAYSPYVDESHQITGFVVCARDVTDQAISEQALSESEERFASAFHTSPAAIAITRIADGTFLDVNQAFLDMFEFSRAEVIGRKSTELGMITAEDRSRLIQEQLESGERPNTDLVARSKSGRPVHLLFSSRPMELAGETHHVTTLIDITEQKMSEQALAESEERLRLAMAAADMGSWDWDLLTGKIVWSEGHARLWGMPPGYFSGTYNEFDARVYPNDRAGLAVAVTRAREDRTAYVHDFRIVWPDGSVHWIEGQGRFEYDSSGQPVRMTGMVRDITTQKNAEVELRESEARFRSVFDQQFQFMAICSPEGRVLEVNDLVLRATSAKREDYVGKFLCDTLPWMGMPDWQVLIREQVKQATSMDDTLFVENKYRRMDGAIRDADAAYTPVRSPDGELRYIVVQATDTTARNQAIAALRGSQQQLRELNASLEQRIAERTRELMQANDDLEGFAHSVAHDLRAPLRALFGFARALREDYADRLDDTGREYTEYIESAAIQMDELSMDLLEYSKIAHRAMTMVAVDLDDVVQRALAQQDDNLRDRQAVVTVANPLGAVVGHKSVLVQVVANLVSNAAKFVAAGIAPEIRLQTETRNGFLRLSVEDNGIGIDPEFHDRIFRVFERLHGIETYPGTGIGLAIVRRAVESMGGRVGVESTPGDGSRFWIELPREQ